MSEIRAAVVGGGPAGLAAALTLARALQPTVVFEAPGPARNAASPAIGSLLGRDLVTPSTLRQTGRAEIERYGRVQFVDQDVQRIDYDAAGKFTVVAADGTMVEAPAVLLACGMVDVMPPFEGLDRFWGESVINCPFCHGIELGTGPWGVFVNRQVMLDVAEIYRMWTDDLTLFLDNGITVSDDRAADLAGKNIRIEDRSILRLDGEGRNLVSITLSGGTRVPCRALVVWPPQRQPDLVASLGLALNEDGGVAVDDGYRTAIEGLYATGDLLYAGHQNVNTALHMGNMAAASMVLDLAMRGWMRAK